MRALLFHAPAYTADGYDDTRPRLVRAACKGSDNNVERRGEIFRKTDSP